MHRAELSIEIGKDSKEYADIAGSSSIKGVTMSVSADGKMLIVAIESEDSKKLLEAMNSFIKELRVIDSVWRIVKQ